MWNIVHRKSPNDSIAEDFPSRGAAEAHLEKLGPVIEKYYRAQANTGNPASRKTTDLPIRLKTICPSTGTALSFIRTWCCTMPTRR